MVVATNTPNTILPRLGLGMAALGRPGYINLNRNSLLPGQDTRSVEYMQTQANKVMQQMLASSSNIAQIPWFDCARSYGLSEKFVGEFLRSNNISPDEVHVTSKWGYTYVADWKISLEEGAPHEVKDHSVTNFLKQIEETYQHIGEYVDLYQVHSATFDSGILTDVNVHQALYKCKKERGWKIGLSVSGPVQDEILREAMKIQVGDSDDKTQRLFDSVQCTFNVLEQRPAKALMEASEAGMDIIIKEGMANGRVFKQDIFCQIAKENGYAIDQLALACILAQPFSPRVLSGAISQDQLSSNMLALSLSEKLKLEQSELLIKIMGECCINSEQYWNDRSNLTWN